MCPDQSGGGALVVMAQAAEVRGLDDLTATDGMGSWRPRGISGGPIRLRACRTTPAGKCRCGSRDAQLFDQGTIEERKRIIRAFVESFRVAGSKRSGEVRLRKLPALESLGNCSVESLAGVRYEAQQTNRKGCLWLVPLAFGTRGTALVPLTAARRRGAAPLLREAAGA